MDVPPRPDQAEAAVPRSAFLERHRLLFSTLIPITAITAVTANSLVGYDTNHSFQIHHEGWFGRNTTNGGADKASHITDYFVVAHLFEDVYRMLGWSENAAIGWGFGLAFATGLANEVSDGFTRHGFSWEDLAMDAAGATAASVISLTHTKDLFGMRTSHLPGSTYTTTSTQPISRSPGSASVWESTSGLCAGCSSRSPTAPRVTGSTPIEHQRQVGIEIGLNLQQILNDLGVKRNTWWGYSLHLFGDNIRFPFTAVGMRFDLNHNKWHGPNSGNYD